MNELSRLSLGELREQYHKIDKIKNAEEALALHDEIQKRRLLNPTNGAQYQQLPKRIPGAVIAITILALIKIALCLLFVVYFGFSPQNVEAILPTTLIAIIILFSIKYRKGLALRICLILDALMMIGNHNFVAAIISIFLFIISLSSNSKAYLRKKETTNADEKQNIEIDGVS